MCLSVTEWLYSLSSACCLAKNDSFFWRTRSLRCFNDILARFHLRHTTLLSWQHRSNYALQHVCVLPSLMVVFSTSYWVWQQKNVINLSISGRYSQKFGNMFFWLTLRSWGQSKRLLKLPPLSHGPYWQTTHTDYNPYTCHDNARYWVQGLF